MISSPRQGETSDEIRIRGEPALVKKVQAELQKVAEGDSEDSIADWTDALVYVA